MPPWLQQLIDRLNQEPEPGDIVQAEIQFIRLSRIDTVLRNDAFEAAYGDMIRRIVALRANLYELVSRRPVLAPERTQWRQEIEADFYADLRDMESAWAEEFNWIEQLTSVVGFDPYTPYWRDRLNETLNDFRRSLRRRIEEFADRWVRTRP